MPRAGAGPSSARTTVGQRIKSLLVDSDQNVLSV